MIMDQQIIPMLSYEDGVKAIEWLCEVFGFEEKTRWVDDSGRLSHGEIAIGEHIIMLASPTPDYQSPRHHREVCETAAKWNKVPYIINGVLVYVDDIEAHFKKAKERGATILSEIETGGPGTRYRAEDLEGQRWMFMQKP
jgi:uncharacterized glyoxalase superfamily protein PhnB